ncbi:MAG: ABC transporter permease subunit [Phycisphaerales bacterium]|nr:ABC transporter permease subunit [Phycisphaerales bacterium]
MAEPDPASTPTPNGASRQWRRNVPGLVGVAFLALLVAACLGSLPWTLTAAASAGGASTVPRYNAGDPSAGRLPPAWWPPDAEQSERLVSLVPAEQLQSIADHYGITADDLLHARNQAATAEAIRSAPKPILGTDVLGRSLLVRCLAGGGISLGIGIAAAGISVIIGTLYGAFAGYVGGKTDAVLMRIVDILYGLPYILLVVLIAVASDALIEEFVSRSGARDAWSSRTVAQISSQISSPTPGPSPRLEGIDLDQPAPADDPFTRALAAELSRETHRTEDQAREQLSRHVDATRGDLLAAAALLARPPREGLASARVFLDVCTLLLAIGGVSWLTMARVIRGQVLSLKGQPFVEAARAAGASPSRIFGRHLLPNLLGPIIVYATLTVPQAILQESFLSFLGIGVKPPLPSWGNLAAEGLSELNSFRSNWWLLLFPCLLLAVSLLALNFVGEGLREAFDPKRARR